MLRFWESGGEEITQEWFERGVGGDELVIGGGVVAFGADGGEEIAEGGFVFIGDEIGFGDEGGAVFEIDEAVVCRRPGAAQNKRSADDTNQLRQFERRASCRAF